VMSTNCMQCGTHRRTGTDLLCDSCRNRDERDRAMTEVRRLQEMCEEFERALARGRDCGWQHHDACRNKVNRILDCNCWRHDAEITLAKWQAMKEKGDG